VRASFALLSLLAVLAAPPAWAQQPPPSPLPPGYVEEPETPPEDPLPPPPREFPVIPDVPLVTAPDAVELLKACKEPAFTDCFRMWQPPPPPPPLPELETGTARLSPPPPPDPALPRDPALGGPVKPPPSDPAKAAASAAADKATFDALAKALKESGLDGKVLLTNPAGGDPTLKLDSQPDKTPTKPRPKP